MKNKKVKVGLVLAGGGAKGAFQAGMLKALKEARILQYVSAVSANSIGSINGLMFMADKIDESYDLWRNFDRKDALTVHNILNIFNKKKGVFSRDGFVDILEKNVDFTHVSESKTDFFITMFNRNTEQIEFHKMNGLSKKEILDSVMASSAIPYVYSPVEINNNLYHDGYKENVPINILKKEGCEVILLLGLKPDYFPTFEERKDVCIIDCTPNFYLGFGKLATLDFSTHNIDYRIENGYLMGKEIIKYIQTDRKSPFYRQNRLKRFIAWCFHKDKINIKGKANYYYRNTTYVPKGELLKTKEQEKIVQ